MKVLLINGSPHKEGCVFTALSEVANQLNKNGIDSEIYHIGMNPVRGCIACGSCKNGDGCVFKDELYTALEQRVKECDALVIGSPVYYAGPNGSLCAILDRLFFACGKYLKYKPGACVVNCRRGGASATYDRLNKYFTISRMPVVSSQYWNSTHGFTPDDVKRDLEGMQTMRTLADNMAYLLKSLKNTTETRPPEEEIIRTNFRKPLDFSEQLCIIDL
ncbi:MAG: flavodoxin family protein [Opitutales bacterium]|nr:flavodoxin family protein [Opitutales bacterium]